MTDKSPFDAFYLFWALSLKEVQDQWEKVIFMQTNREDLGDRYKYIEIPFSEDKLSNTKISSGYRTYYEALAVLRNNLKMIPHSLDELN